MTARLIFSYRHIYLNVIATYEKFLAFFFSIAII
jgi:hypothetical protein